MPGVPVRQKEGTGQRHFPVHGQGGYNDESGEQISGEVVDDIRPGAVSVLGMENSGAVSTRDVLMDDLHTSQGAEQRPTRLGQLRS